MMSESDTSHIHIVITKIILMAFLGSNSAVTGAKHISKSLRGSTYIEVVSETQTDAVGIKQAD